MAASKATLKLIAAAKKQAGGKKKSKRSKKSVTLSKGEVFKALELVNQVNREIGRVIGCGIGGGKKKAAKKRSSKKRASKKVMGGFPFLAVGKKTRIVKKSRRSKAAQATIKRRAKKTMVTFVGLAKKTKKRRSKKR